jgi:predicted DNA-binding protein YlxM (UPF0122 family)
MELDKKVLLSTLFDIYHMLLTQKQQDIFKAYVLDDYSLKETAEAFDVSRSAIFDHIQKIETHLLHYEASLKIYEKLKLRTALYDLLEKNLDMTYVHALRKLDE